LIEEFELPLSHNAAQRIIKERGLTKRRKKKKETQRDLRAVKAAYRPFMRVQLDVKYLNDIPFYWRQMVDLKLPRFQYTFRDESTGATFVDYGDELSIRLRTSLLSKLVQPQTHHLHPLPQIPSHPPARKTSPPFSSNLLAQSHPLGRYYDCHPSSLRVGSTSPRVGRKIKICILWIKWYADTMANGRHMHNGRRVDWSPLVSARLQSLTAQLATIVPQEIHEADEIRLSYEWFHDGADTNVKVPFDYGARLESAFRICVLDGKLGKRIDLHKALERFLPMGLLQKPPVGI
jgi:hypothetical protein